MKQNNLLIGSHVSFNKSEQLLASVTEAVKYNANTFMFYTGAPQNTVRSEINDFKSIEAIELMKKHQIDYSNVIVHAPYIINLANPEKAEFGIRFLTEEIERCEQLGIRYLILHPGSHVGNGVDVGIKNIIEGLNMTFMNNHSNVQVLLETMAGKGTEIGRDFNEIRSIIEGVAYKNRIGVCMDTCHLNDAGYDLVNFDQILEDFDQIVGIDYLKCIHVNDSKNEKNTHKDRHENIGFGTLGFDCLLNIIYHPKLEKIAKILETPYINDHPPYKQEIEMIRNKKFKENLKEEIIKSYK